MRYKLAKRYAKFWSRAFWFELILTGLLVGAVTKATVTITTPIAEQTVGTTAYFYTAPSPSAAVDPGPSPAATAFLDTGSGYYQVDLKQNILSGSANGQIRLALTFNEVNVTLGAGQKLAIMGFYATDNSGTVSSIHSVQFARVNYTNNTYANDIDCTTNPAECYKNATSQYVGLYFPPAGGTVYLSFYPGDLCSAQSGVCATDVAATQLNLKFIVRPVTLSGQSITDTIDTTFVSGASDSGVIALNFQNSLPQFSGCPNPFTNTSLYFPGDGEILLATNAFASYLTLASAPFTSVWAATNYLTVGTSPPVSPVIVTAPTANSYSAFLGAQIFSRTSYGGEQRLTGYLNSSSSQYTSHTTVFGVKDAAGLVAYDSTCFVQQVLTADIQGFLDGKRCFIATAAYDDVDAAPVELLRNFRDVVLLKFKWGRAFVKNYYRFSPPAAQWLSEHRYFRIPVMILLTPVELIAWLLLHPAIFLMLCLFVGSIGGAFLYKRRELLI